MQRCQAGARRPVGPARRSVLPQATRHLLGAADYEALVFVAVGHHDTEDLQHRVREIGVPTPGPESDLTEHLTVVEGQLRERFRTRDKVVERAVVPYRHQVVPQGLQARNITGSDRVLNLGEPHGFQRIGPRLGHLLEQRRQGVGLLGVMRRAFDMNDRAVRTRCKRIGKRRSVQPQEIDVVIERGRRDRETHPAQLGDHAGRRTLELL